MIMISICEAEMENVGHRPLITLEDILNDVCSVFGQPLKEIKGKCRKRDYVICRLIYSYVARMNTSKYCYEIANEVGYKEHSIVIRNTKLIRRYFQIKDGWFLGHWDHYISKSKIWNHLNEKQINRRRVDGGNKKLHNKQQQVLHYGFMDALGNSKAM